MQRKTIRHNKRAFLSGSTTHRSLLAAGAVGLAFLASHATAAEDEPRPCMCSHCMAPKGDNIAQVEEATEGEDAPVSAALQVDDGNRWTRFASGTSFVRGEPVRLTFGIVPDGTSISGVSSNLESFLNSTFGSSDRWLPLVQNGYQRWAELSGVTFVYEDSDDGAFSPSSRGILGVRADLRLGGHAIDGSTIGFNFFPNFGDGVLDTSSPGFFGNSRNNFRALRNTIAHEVGHGLGLPHFESNNSNGLLEPFINTSFDGPQHGDILAIQRLYGDALEANGGNDSVNRPTELGTVSGSSTQTLSIGTDADDNTTFVSPSETDFVSIDGTSDTDVFSFTLGGSNSFNVRVQLEPKGPTYNQGPQGGTQSSFNSKALTDLELELLDGNGNVIATAEANDAGLGELIDRDLPAGDYLVRVSAATGAIDNVQLYRLDVSASELAPAPAPIEPVAASFVAAHLAYRGSSFDGAGNIAPDKTPLLNGETADFDNYSSYTRGINRVVIDIRDLPTDGADLSASDFALRVGNDNTPSQWANAPAPTAVTVLPGDGSGGSDRVIIDWADNAIQNQWLQVTLLANDRTALPADFQINSGLEGQAAATQFYFGSARFEGGSPSGTHAIVDFFDAIGAFRNQAGNVPITNPFDYDRDGDVDFFDAIGAFRNQSTEVQRITPPGPMI